MRKTACTDNEIASFYPKLTEFTRAVAALVPSGARVSVYARSSWQNMYCAFPKKRKTCSVQQVLSHITVKIPSQIEAFRLCLLRQGCYPDQKASPAFFGIGMI